MTTEKLLQLKSELEIKIDSIISDEERNEVEQRVFKFREQLLNELKEKHSKESEEARAKLVFINELLELDASEPVIESVVESVPEPIAEPIAEPECPPIEEEKILEDSNEPVANIENVVEDIAPIDETVCDVSEESIQNERHGLML